MNSTPTPFDPLNVFRIIGKSVSRFSNAFKAFSLSVISEDLGCLKPKSASLIDVLYLSVHISIQSLLLIQHT